jgi:hypothetical protein
MNIYQTYKHLLDVINKDQRGRAFSIDQYNNMLPFENIALFQYYVTKAEQIAAQGQKELSQVIYEMANLSNFIETEELVGYSQAPYGSILIGRVNTPDNFQYSIALTSGNQPVEVVSIQTLQKYRRGVVHEDLAENPVAFIGNHVLEFLPNDLDSMVLTYLRTPVEPYLDYCVDADDMEVFMPAGYYIIYVYGTLSLNLYDDKGKLVRLGVTHPFFEGYVPPVNPTAYTSKTVEIEWDEVKWTVLADRILFKMGLNQRDPLVIQTAAKMTQDDS